MIHTRLARLWAGRAIPGTDELKAYSPMGMGGIIWWGGWGGVLCGWHKPECIQNAHIRDMKSETEDKFCPEDIELYHNSLVGNALHPRTPEDVEGGEYEYEYELLCDECSMTIGHSVRNFLQENKGKDVNEKIKELAEYLVANVRPGGSFLERCSENEASRIIDRADGMDLEDSTYVAIMYSAVGKTQLEALGDSEDDVVELGSELLHGGRIPHSVLKYEKGEGWYEVNTIMTLSLDL